MDDVILQENHKKTINSKITKAINAIPDETIQEIFLDYVQNEIDSLYNDGSNFQEIVDSQLRELIRNMFVEKGLIKQAE